MYSYLTISHVFESNFKTESLGYLRGSIYGGHHHLAYAKYFHVPEVFRKQPFSHQYNTLSYGGTFQFGYQWNIDSFIIDVDAGVAGNFIPSKRSEDERIQGIYNFFKARPDLDGIAPKFNIKLGYAF